MKTVLITIFTAVTLLPGWVCAYDAPSDDAIQGVLSNPASITSLLSGANVNEAADAIVRVFAAVDGAALTDDQKTQFIALLVARVMRAASASDRGALAAALLSRVNADWKPIIAAAAVSATGDAEVKTALASETNAVADPKGVLGAPLYNLIAGAGAGGGLLGASLQKLVLPPPPMTITGQTVNPGAGGIADADALKAARVRAAFPTSSADSIKLLCLLSEDDLNRYLNAPKVTRTRALENLRGGDVDGAVRVLRSARQPQVADRYQGQ